MQKILLVSGVFDDQGGRPSGYMSKLGSAIQQQGCMLTHLNGGTLKELASMFGKVSNYQIVMWMADVDNAIEKYLPNIKKLHPHIYLVSSKYNQDRYSVLELMQRALSAKSNLLLEFNKRDNKILATLYDPLCNAYCVDESDVYQVAKTLIDRLNFITTLKRVPTVQIDGVANVPNNESFFEIVREHSKTFSTLIQGVNPDRFLGNCSFRCESGFPSFKEGNLVYVSKRNCNKDTINQQGFVAIDLDKSTDDQVCYYGKDKPSVDTAIQVQLYKTLSGKFGINYMLHSHTYIKDAPFTKNKLPCGSIEEVKEILRIVMGMTVVLRNPCYFINLRGHGSLVLAHSLEQLKNVPYVRREQPEIY